MTTPDELDRSDMERLAKGGDAALNSLMDRHAEKLFHYLVRQLGNAQDAEDLAQESFVRVYQNRARFDPAQKFTTWLYTIATNLGRDRLRYRARHPTVSLQTEDETESPLESHLPAETPGPREQLEQRETAEAVRRALAILPEELRTPLILSEYEGLSHADIAQILRCTSKAVETRLYRARNKLRQTLAPGAEL
jgi:RNA polymerase sigma-70 factor (ECF subfamily)